MLTKLLKDVNTYLALIGGLLEGFFGPTWHSIGTLLILAVIDLVIGYLKNKRKNGEPFKVSKFGAKLAQMGAFLVALAAAVVSDKFFMDSGLQAYWVANKVCTIYGLYQFLKIIENLGQWLPIVGEIRDMIRNKLSKTEDKPNENI